MKKLKTILQCNSLYYLVFLFAIIVCIFSILIPNSSKYNLEDRIFEVKILDIYIDGNYLSMQVFGKEKLQTVYYFNTYSEKESFINNYQIGDLIYIEGMLSIPSGNSNPNTFNYKNYLYYEKIHYILQIDTYKKISSNKNVLDKLKNVIISRIQKIPKSSPYLNALILGNDRYISSDKIDIYQTIGISHLLAISGMHIGLFSKILAFLLEKLGLNDKKKYFIIICFLIFYMFLVGFTPSVLRAVTFFILITINKVFKLKIKILNLFILTISFIVLFDPFIIFKIGFQFSSIISLGLILFNDLINNKKKYVSKLFMVSFISFLISMPICLFHFYQINFLSIIYNLLFVPFMSYVLFPLSLITFIFPWFDSIMHFFINIFENLSNLCSLIPSILIFKKINILVYILYLLLVFCILKKNFRTKILIAILVAIMGIHYCYNHIFIDNYMLAIDVGQGDSILLHYNGKSILIDTGGKIKYDVENWKIRNNNSNFSDNTIIPIFKSFGIRKLDYLILTHGDYDHMGEAINLVNNFKVEKVIFNCGAYNDLENELIKVLDKKKILYYSCIKELNIDNNKLYFLNNKDYDNENDNSSVIYTELNNYKFLFMGDAGVEVEEDLIEKYNLKNIDALKVGHHGSKTSTGKNFINEINPKYSIISVGKNNRYGHPNDNVLNNLVDSQIYRTDQDGSIMFKIKSDKLKIETCAP